MPFTTTYFTGFEYQPAELAKFLQTYSIFTIMLRTGAIIHYQPEQVVDFKRWLLHHNIEDIRVSMRNNATAF